MDSESIQKRVQAIQERIAKAADAAGRQPEEITLCAATKTQSDAAIRAGIAAGISVCGENRVQEMTAHLAANAYEGAQLHFIGHLQTNKVRQVVGTVQMIHSIDSLHLLQAVNAQAEKLGICQNILLEINIGQEQSKGGISLEEAPELAAQAGEMKHICLRGLMAIPPISAAPGGNRKFFSKMYQSFIDIQGKISDNQNVNQMDCLSMGMSDDFEDAIAEGATLVRIGSAIFGPRLYT